jgi:cell division protein FtsW (lipid II flippase)
MFESIKSYLNNWNVSKSERQKLQHTYLLIAVIVVLVSGIISLLNAKLGHRIVLVAVFAVLAFLANALVWNLLQSSVIAKLVSKPKRK